MAQLIGRGRYRTAAYPIRSAAAPGQIVSPLTADYWVDSGTTLAVADRNGSVLAPYASLQEAYDASVTAGLTTVNMMVVKSDIAASLNMSAGTVQTSLIALSGFLASLADPNYLQQVLDITVSGTAGLFANGMHIAGDVSAPDGAIVMFENCISLGALTTTSNVFVTNSALCAAGGACSVAGLQFLDAFSEQQMLEAATAAWASGTLINSTNAGTGANVAEVYDDASEASETFTGQSRRVWPANTITAPRSVTMLVGGGGDFATGYIDIYPQPFDVTLNNDLGLLRTVTANTPAMRYGFVLPDAAHWVQFSAEILGA